MVRKYRVVDFSDLEDKVFGYLSEFGESMDNEFASKYLVESDLEVDIASMIRDLIKGHEYYEETEKFDDGDIEFKVKASRDDFDAIMKDEDGTMSIGVRLDFDIFYDNIHDGFESDAQYNFEVEIKGVK